MGGQVGRYPVAVESATQRFVWPSGSRRAARALPRGARSDGRMWGVAVVLSRMRCAEYAGLGTGEWTQTQRLRACTKVKPANYGRGVSAVGQLTCRRVPSVLSQQGAADGGLGSGECDFDDGAEAGARVGATRQMAWSGPSHLVLPCRSSQPARRKQASR